MRILSLVADALRAVVAALPGRSGAQRATSPHDVPYEEKFDACTRAIASGRHSGKTLAEFHFERGHVFYNADDTDNAIEDFSAAIRHHPLPDAYLLRGTLYQAKKRDLPRALADYDQAVRLRPRATGGPGGSQPRLSKPSRRNLCISRETTGPPCCFPRAVAFMH